MSRTINEVINSIKSGSPVSMDECVPTMLALHAMLSGSRMILETIAAQIGNERNTHLAAIGYLGSLDLVREERATWMESNPKAWLIMNKSKSDDRN